MTKADVDTASSSGGGFKPRLIGPTGPRAGHQRPSPDKDLGIYTEAPSWGLPSHSGLVHVLASGPKQTAVLAWMASPGLPVSPLEKTLLRDTPSAIPSKPWRYPEGHMCPIPSPTTALPEPSRRSSLLGYPEILSPRGDKGILEWQQLTHHQWRLSSGPVLTVLKTPQALPRSPLSHPPHLPPLQP